MARLVLTFVGDDRPGLVDAVSEAIAARGGTWLESRSSRLDPVAPILDAEACGAAERIGPPAMTRLRRRRADRDVQPCTSRPIRAARMLAAKKLTNAHLRACVASRYARGEKATFPSGTGIG